MTETTIRTLEWNNYVEYQTAMFTETSLDVNVPFHTGCAAWNALSCQLLHSTCGPVLLYHISNSVLQEPADKFYHSQGG